MVDFTEFKIGSKVKLKLSDDTTHEYVIVIVDEIEWNMHRHPFLVDLKIESSTDEEKWPVIKDNEQFRYYFQAHLGVMVFDLLDSDLISEEIDL